MRIKSLQLQGFKSFVDRTTFTFKDGITAVVGPNGCGKSNVADAVRWVMGEQSARRLRGKTMEDVIFGGSSNRPPIGMAEVVLSFENNQGKAPADYADYSEIEICRRLYRSGESEYLINKAPVRLKDINDFFRDSGVGAKGYTIVEQGRVAEIVSAKADERRLLIEEAAGITKYKARRRESESKIKSTEQNLDRVNDILGEIRRQISSLERQARKAARYKRFKETQRILELSLARDERNELLEGTEQARGRVGQLRDEVTALSTRLAERELALEEKRIGLTEAEKAVSQGSERLYALRSEIKNLEGQIELGQREGENISESNDGRRRELGQLREQLTQVEAEAVEARQELDQLAAAVQGQQATVDVAESEVAGAQEELNAAELERDSANQSLVGVLTSVARGEDRITVLADRHAAIDQRLRSADRDYEEQQSAARELVGEENELEQNLRSLLTEHERFQEQLIVAMRHHERATEKLAEVTGELQQRREQLGARGARLSSLTELLANREDLGPGTRHLLEQGDEAASRFGIRGLVRELLDVEAHAVKAVGAVLAERADALVLEDGARVVDALSSLRASQAGRGVFLLETSEAPVTGIVPMGEPILECVEARPGHEGLAQRLLGDVYLVDSLSEPLDRYRSTSLPATFVTLEGDLITPTGVVCGGGGAGAGGSMARQSEVRELQAEVERLSLEVKQFESAHASAMVGLESASQELDNMRSRQHTAAMAVATQEKDLERVSERGKALGEARESRIAERADLLAESQSLAEEQVALQGQLEAWSEERGQRQSAFDTLGLRIGSLGRELSRRQTRLTELRVAHNNRIEGRDRLHEQVSRFDGSTRETAEWISRREEEIQSGLGRIEELEAERGQAKRGLEEQLIAEEHARVENDATRDGYERESQAVREFDEGLRELRTDLSGRQEQSTEADFQLRETELRLDHQAEHIRDRWSVDLAIWELPPLEETPGEAAGEASAAAAEAEVAARLRASAEGAVASEAGEAGEEEEAEPPLRASESASAVREARQNAELARAPKETREGELATVQKALESLGEVNVGAIEEHEELAERFRFLSEQKADLEKTIESLRDAIARINRTSRRRFRETFEAVSAHFSENFPRLFGGGKASLQLTEAEDILEAGIDIMAMPPGKRLQNVNLLSGGEKTMTALALLVAIFQVRSSPFFLLDEVDAALDDANVGRFNGLITDMAAQSQFLVITHNKRTIEVADVLYGVTMEQKGVSKLVGVELS
ncbi:MAG: chromosome segregation protein SMC [Myxococcota bacterium]|nr:chromosome segregation protein SMC [Myxococcota bacterium]